MTVKIIMDRLSILRKTHPLSAWPIEVPRIALEALRKNLSRTLYLHIYKTGLHRSSQFGRRLFIMNPANISSTGQVLFGDNVRLISEFNDSSLQIGADVEFGSNSRIDFSGGLKIDNSVHISSDVFVYTHSHGLEPRSKASKKFLEIDKSVWIGSRCTIMDSVDHIGEGAVIGTGSVLTKDVQPNEIWAGNPAKKIGLKTPEP